MRSLCYLCLLVFLMLSHAADSQDRVQYYTKDWTVAKDRNSVKYFVLISKLNDTAHVCKFYQAFGPMIRLETFKDSTLTIPHGYYVWYNKVGVVDSMGFMAEGKKHGTWGIKYSKRFERLEIREYKNGELLYEGPPKSKLDDQAENPDVFSPAIYPGGTKEWGNYLSAGIEKANLFAPLRRTGQISVAMMMVIDTEGVVRTVIPMESGDIYADTNAEYLIRKSVNWKPAMRNGVAVRYTFMQPLSFR